MKRFPLFVDIKFILIQLPCDYRCPSRLKSTSVLLSGAVTGCHQLTFHNFSLWNSD